MRIVVLLAVFFFLKLVISKGKAPGGVFTAEVASGDEIPSLGGPGPPTRKLLQLLHARKDANRHSIASMHLKEGTLLLPRRRRLSQGPSAAPPSPSAHAPGPAISPRPVNVSPPISPFVPSNESGLVCCCQMDSNAMVQQPYQKPSPPNCCCGSPDTCCPTTSNPTTLVCGGGTVCVIFMLTSILVALLIIAICIMGAYISRRRRRRAMLASIPQAAAGANSGSPSFATPPGIQMVQILPEQLETLSVRPPDASDLGTSKECPICLDVIGVHTDTWTGFPCGHGCCTPCLNDLLRHSSRPVNRSTLAILCPLCRKLAVAPCGQREGGGATPEPASPVTGVGRVDSDLPGPNIQGRITLTTVTQNELESAPVEGGHREPGGVAEVEHENDAMTHRSDNPFILNRDNT